MKDKNIISLFPTPVYTNHLEPLNNKELKKIRELKKLEKNPSDKHTYVLEEKDLKNLKKQINASINDYVDNIIKPKNNLEFYITQSWLNWTDEKQCHHGHFHSNSIISGVYYVDADYELDFISFKKLIYDQIKIYPKEFNSFNSDTWWVPVETNKLILFPSILYHEIGNIKETYNTRISLAFNVFAKGELGSRETLTELNL